MKNCLNFLFALCWLWLGLAVKLEAVDYCESLNPVCTCMSCMTFGSYCAFCRDFTSFEQINFLKLNTSVDATVFEYVILSPMNQSAFIDDGSLNLKGLNIKQTLSIQNVSGMSITAEPFKDVHISKQRVDDELHVIFENTDLSNLKFKNQKLDASSCKMSLLNDTEFTPNIFKRVYYLEFGQGDNFNEPICTLVFKDSAIHSLSIGYLDARNLGSTKFVDPINDVGDPDYAKLLNSSITSLKINDAVYVDQLDSSFLNPNLFKNLVRLQFVGKLNSIAPNTFEPLKSLEKLDLDLDKWKDFIKSNTMWMKELNSDIKVDPKNKTQVDGLKSRQFILSMSDLYLKYDFPEEDLCYYKNFPHEQLVYPELASELESGCSCTTYWLIQHLESFREPYLLMTPYVGSCITHVNLTHKVEECDLEKRIYQCKLEYIKTKCTQMDQSSLECGNFTELDELIFSGYDTETFAHLKLKPLLPITFNDSLNLRFIRFEENRPFTIELNNFNGFDLSAKSFEIIKDRINQSTFIMDNSDFVFYYNGINLYDAEACIKLEMDQKFTSFLTSNLVLLGSMRYNKSEKVCPYIFKNPGLRELEIFKLSEENRLRFFDFSNGRSESPASRRYYDFSIKSLLIKQSHLFNLDTSLLNPDIFRQIESLSVSLNSQLYHVDSDLFSKSFPWLKYINFDVSNLKEFVHSSTNEWFTGLNMNVEGGSVNGTEIMKEKILLRLADETFEYEFPEEDFCYFQYFPHDRLVFPIINTKPNLECSCTVLWLLKDLPFIDGIEPESDKAGLFDVVLTSSVKNCYQSSNFMQMLNDCNFGEKLNDCKAFTGTRRTTTTTEKPVDTTRQTDLEGLLDDEKAKSRNLTIAVSGLAFLVCLMIAGFVFLVRKHLAVQRKFMQSESLAFRPLT